MKSCEELLKLIAELKHQVLLNDFESLLAESERAEEDLSAARAAATARLQHVRALLDARLAALILLES